MWKNEYEKINCIAAKKWMNMYDKYKNKPGEAEIYWQKILSDSKNN